MILGTSWAHLLMLEGKTIVCTVDTNVHFHKNKNSIGDSCAAVHLRAAESVPAREPPHLHLQHAATVHHRPCHTVHLHATSRQQQHVLSCATAAMLQVIYTVRNGYRLNDSRPGRVWFVTSRLGM
jgi:hypothetical protein